ncbi:Ktr system potassium uptake protein B [Oxobacter pfennigii]|uniref:Ktr system potassium uptake protein B n=1 Tax=Oxobacter pfennigii TaxID=36849 RepID=A0A0P8W164_9CLOT|nr:TrkH family potassium uptake protein [Oxobacter pfennigii]KPU42123.1 Ktr system potassium uptake protein B [Oxobacter pfennigii]
MEKSKSMSVFKRLKPVQILSIGFALLILLGAVLLTLPVSSAKGESTSFLTALFTATSAVCVTGLVVVDTGTYWSVFGQIVILLLIQIGGLGFMSFATLIAFIVGKKITLKERLVMQEAMNSFSIQGLVKLARYVLIFTFTIEGIGALLLAVKFIPVYGLGKGIYFSIFHSISAYCNAGFDLIGNFQSLVPFQGSIIINFTIMSLIIIGGMGFVVHSDIYRKKEFKKFSLHSKVVLLTTLVLFVLGTIIFFLLEYNNPGTLGSMSFMKKIIAALFSAVTPRTAGFNTIDLASMTTASKFITIILMFIGASPGSTGGGIKTTTAAAIILTIISVIKGREDTEIFGKRLSRAIVLRALAIAVISLALVVFNVIILSITEKGAEFMEIIYESVSAFGTVGLSLGLTPELTAIGKIIILLTMYAGRVGPLTLTLALAKKQLKNAAAVKYPEDRVLVG